MYKFEHIVWDSFVCLGCHEHGDKENDDDDDDKKEHNGGYK